MKFHPLKNYTLLEILVVVAIIVILCSLLFSGFTQVKETAKRMNCLNKTKDIAWAQGACASENNGNIPMCILKAFDHYNFKCNIGGFEPGTDYKMRVTYKKMKNCEMFNKFSQIYLTLEQFQG